MKTTLICTVGGSHEPILQAIRSNTPAHVCFVCSSDDPATGSKGSHIQITGKGLVIKERPGDQKATLPSIPEQAGIEEGRFEILTIHADDFDNIYETISQWLESRDQENEYIIADYTGGTKSMSAALVAATLDNEKVGLQLVSGGRSNLTKIDAGSGLALPASVERTRFKRKLSSALSTWHYFAYDECVNLLKSVHPPSDNLSKSEYTRYTDLSTAFSAWDRFEHEKAADIINCYRKIFASSCRTKSLLSAIDLLTKDCPGREPMRLFDLWHNAERCAARKRYDDAVARLYRLLEWSAQWLLRESSGIETADVPKERIPAGIRLTQNRDGKYQAALLNAWEMVAHYDKNMETFWKQQKNTVLDLLQGRNHSILAHGFKPLHKEDWNRMSRWVREQLLPVLLTKSKTKPYRITKLPEQLPTVAP